MRREKIIKMRQLGVKGPSKYLSLGFLAKLRENRYASENTYTNELKDYCKEEVDQLYWEKGEKQAQNMLKEANQLQGREKIMPGPRKVLPDVERTTLTKSERKYLTDNEVYRYMQKVYKEIGNLDKFLNNKKPGKEWKCPNWT